MQVLSWRNWSSKVAACALLTAAALPVTAAAGGSAFAATPAMTTVIAYFNPGSADAGSVEYAQKAGIFAKYGLNVKFQYSTEGGPQIIPALVSGKVQFGEPGVEDTIVATAKGIPLEMIGSVDIAAPKGSEDWTVDLVAKNSSITSVCQLPGKSVAINSLLGLGQMYVDADYYNAHCAGDPSDTGWKNIHFVAILFPEMLTALERGEVSAIWTLEPFRTENLMTGQARELAGAETGVAAGIPITAIDTSHAYLYAHPQTVKDFQEAMLAANKYLEANPSASRAIVGADTSTPKSVLPKMLLPTYATAAVNPSLIQLESTFNVKFGLITKTASLSTWVTPDPINVASY
jgi:NitT/TauT family transport system substrate-binding protein